MTQPELGPRSTGPTARLAAHPGPAIQRVTLKPPKVQGTVHVRSFWNHRDQNVPWHERARAPHDPLPTRPDGHIRLLFPFSLR